MNDIISSAAYVASKTLAGQGVSAKRSHLSEIIAALLGYRTYAALVVGEADPKLDYHLEDAEHLVLNLPMGVTRATALGLEKAGSIIADACVEALKVSVIHARVYVGIADFYDSHAREALSETIYNDNDVANAMAESNASFPDEPEMGEPCPSTADLWAAVDEWTIEAEGSMTGEYDPEGDRMFNGDKLNCRGWLTYLKAGRAGLVFLDSGGTGGADDSWRDLDREDEWEHFESLKRDHLN